MTIEAKDLQSAITQASIQFQCSVMDIEYTVIQYPKQGFLGLFRKNAIIEARNVKKAKAEKKEFSKTKNEERFNKKKDSTEKTKTFISEKNTQEKSDYQETKEVKKDFSSQEERKEQEIPQLKKEKYVVKSDAIFDSFHKESEEEKRIDCLEEIEIQTKKLIDSLGFEVELVELRMYDENNIFIKIDGKDSALLIGKGACRYKALSYLLHSWINSKYNLFVRLEISHFLENQTQMMQQYLQSVIEKIESTGRAQTKPLDGVLVKIALELLRKRFPNKYVGTRQGEGEQKIIIVNDFIK